MELEKVKRPIRKLRKAFKKLSDDPRPEDVHTLRTQTRRLEAIVVTLKIVPAKKAKRLLKSVTPIRKAAGEVRDMDMLIGNVLTKLSRDNGSDAVVRLVEHLGKMRTESASDLLGTIAQQRKNARRNLKQYAKQIEHRIGGEGTGKLDLTSAPGTLVDELIRWPRLNATNMHSFRIKVKELLYMLQLSQHPDAEWMQALGEVKDQVGDWHDWEKLAKVAQKILSPELDGAVLKQIDATRKSKLKQALAAANTLRTQHLGKGGKVR